MNREVLMTKAVQDISSDGKAGNSTVGVHSVIYRNWNDRIPLTRLFMSPNQNQLLAECPALTDISRVHSFVYTQDIKHDYQGVFFNVGQCATL
jgi:hypothetical protein